MSRTFFDLSRIVIFPLIVVFAAGLVPAAVAAAPAEQEVICAPEYRVQAGDWLSSLAGEYLGSVTDYPKIVAATNAKHATDDTFASISDPNVIEIGWKLCIPPAGGEAEVTQPADQTQVMTFVPAIPEGEPAAGTCSEHSRIWPREDAWHCSMADADILDPCFAVPDGSGETVVVCGADPVDDAMAQAIQPVKVKLSEPLPLVMVPADKQALLNGNGWKLVLSDGTICAFTALAEPVTVDGKNAMYHCGQNEQGQYLWIVGDLQTGAVWQGEQYVASMGEDGVVIKDPRTVQIRIVWQ